jgi:peptide-methionine (S)-S-oxide reductase
MSQETAAPKDEPPPAKKTALATFGGGCFWCLEAVFERIPGVLDVVSGYSGGGVPNPTYEEVCTGQTGHAEVVQIAFDPKLVPYEELLDVFWACHDPTSLNRQGPDFGTQYRSVIFFHDDGQKQLAIDSAKKLKAAKKYRSPIVTQLEPLPVFYPAEPYHQDYYRNHPNAPYCRIYIAPKVRKLKSH